MRQNYSSTVPTKKVGTCDRMVSAFIGSVLLTNALNGKNKPIKIAAGSYLLYRAFTGTCPVSSGISSVIPHPKNITIKSTVTVNKKLSEVYDFWRDLEILPKFMKHLESVEITGRTTSLWKAKVPGGLGTVEWESTIVHDEVNERIGWKSNDGALIENAGNVHFKDAGKFGTEVYVVISYRAPAGKVGELIGKLFNPAFEEMVREDIKNFKRYIETGEIPTIKGQASGKNKIAKQ